MLFRVNSNCPLFREAITLGSRFSAYCVEGSRFWRIGIEDMRIGVEVWRIGVEGLAYRGRGVTSSFLRNAYRGRGQGSNPGALERVSTDLLPLSSYYPKSFSVSDT